jgi:hypothetical protein
MASIGAAKIAPGTPHIQNQNTSAKMISTGFSVKRQDQLGAGFHAPWKASSRRGRERRAGPSDAFHNLPPSRPFAALRRLRCDLMIFLAASAAIKPRPDLLDEVERAPYAAADVESALRAAYGASQLPRVASYVAEPAMATFASPLRAPQIWHELFYLPNVRCRQDRMGTPDWEHAREGALCFEGFPMEYSITAAFLLAVVAGSFAAVILGGYGIAQLIAAALWTQARVEWMASPIIPPRRDAIYAIWP